MMRMLYLENKLKATPMSSSKNNRKLLSQYAFIIPREIQKMKWTAVHKDYFRTCLRVAIEKEAVFPISTEVKWILTVGSLPATEATRQVCFINGNVVSLAILAKHSLHQLKLYVAILMSIVMYVLLLKYQGVENSNL